MFIEVDFKGSQLAWGAEVSFYPEVGQICE